MAATACRAAVEKAGRNSDGRSDKEDGAPGASHRAAS